jgi:phage-related protein
MYLIRHTTVEYQPKPPVHPEGSPSARLPLEKRLPVVFYRTEAGGEPVREWLRALPASDRKRIGEDLKTVEFGWPLGMPLCRRMEQGIYEVRSNLSQGRIARVLFYVDPKQRMVLLHAFIKKARNTPPDELRLARTNKSKHERGLQ